MPRNLLCRDVKVSDVTFICSKEERQATLDEFNAAMRGGVRVLAYPHEGGAPEYANLFMDKAEKRIMWMRESGAVGGCEDACVTGRLPAG